jgi:glutathione S-transferase
MYTLYYSPGACSLAIHVALNEIGADFKLENTSIMDGKNRSDEFLKVNPRGQVPVLTDDNKVIREGAAILIYLLEKHNSDLLPKEISALEWLMFCNATLHPAYSRVFFLMRNLKENDANRDHLFEVAVSQINKLWADVEERLASNEYIAGSSLTIADILLTVIYGWSIKMPKSVFIGEKTSVLINKIKSLPSFQKAVLAEKN